MIAPEITIHRVGHEEQPVAIVDGFHPDPAALRQLAGDMAFGPGANHYPGIRADLPPDYFKRIASALDASLSEAFGHVGEVGLIDASYSIVTTPPDCLTVPQRLPHMDAVDLRRIALVHYLSPEDRDGTAFFRHRSTGFETVDQVRSPVYFGQLNAELRHGEVPDPGYVAGSTRLFAQTDQIEARYNRALIYRSAMLHSGAISPEAVLSADPARGRLTVTAFLSLT
jgi:hypothetical protein